MGLIWSRLRSYRKLLFVTLVLATINQVFSLLDPQIFRMIIDQYATKATTLPREVFIKGILLLLLASIMVAFISRVAKNFQDYFVNVITQRVGTLMYANSVHHTFSLPYSIFEDQRSGEILQKLQKARTDTQTVIGSFVNVLFLSLVGMTFVIVYAFTVHWMIGLAYFLLIPLLGSFMYVLSRKIKAAQQAIVKESAGLAGSTTETLRNVELVKSLGLEDQEIKRLNTVNNLILTLELKKIKMIRKLSFIQGTTINAMRSALLFLMLWLIFNGNITLGEFFSLFVYSFFIFSPLAEFGTLASQYQEAKASNEQLENILKIKPAPKNPSAAVLDKIDSLRFDKVSFIYGSSTDPSLHAISFTLQAGETIAFAGPSGSGKSTIVKLLVGLYQPTKGTLLVNGVPSTQVDYDAVRRKIGLVSQETQLFAGTIKENLLFVRPDATDKECMQVLTMASVTNILERGGKGLETKIGEGGIKISGGERQRLAIARALLRNPDLLIFDEATSSLDSLTEKAITTTIQDVLRYRPNIMVVLVAHRLSTIAHAKMIYVLENGKIVEHGNHHALVRKKGLYAAFWRQQSAQTL